ncbi:MAG: glycogen synthase GlgA [Acidobacteriota bacterium]|nr:glycogen synthase GlgA [Acidobacteriota bacterium]
MPRILMVTSEAAPFAKTGGLADVLGALPPALAKLGEEVAVIMPRYGSVPLAGAELILPALPITVGPRTFTTALYQVKREGVRYLFVDCPPLYARPGIYNEWGAEYLDNHIRFATLNRAALEIARNIFPADIFHAHDWPAGLVAPYLAAEPAFAGAKCVFTIHNLGYQGNFPGYLLADLGLSPALFNPRGLEFWGDVSFLKAGIVWSDAITTVSPTYAKEIQTPEYGHGLDGVLRDRADKISGILNGVDYAEWNPEADPYLTNHFSAKDLSGKRLAKRALLKALQLLPDRKRPLIGIVSRFASQKGFDLVEAIAPQLAERDLAFAVLGSGDARYEQMFRGMAAAHPEKVAVRVGYDNVLAHRIEAGADLFLMPSQYEPCGLNQMYSLRYGTLPIVRATGGLDDTVDETSGFKFSEYTPQALLAAIDQAHAAWQNRDQWLDRMRRGMAKDFSWDISAAAYQRLYRSLIAPPD